METENLWSGAHYVGTGCNIKEITILRSPGASVRDWCLVLSSVKGFIEGYAGVYVWPPCWQTARSKVIL